jgi:F-type H+-transporting ATPase subunit delta
MREPTIAQNYAEALFTLAQKHGEPRAWGETFLGVADAMQRDAKLRAFLASPKVDQAQKGQVIAKALGGRVPPMFVRYLQSLLKNRRQMMIPAIAREYMDIVDRAEGRVHANVTVFAEPDQATRDVVARELSRAFGKEVVPHFTVAPEILGGVVVRMGDTVLDGSVRRRLGTLRTRMLAGKR